MLKLLNTERSFTQAQAQLLTRLVSTTHLQLSVQEVLAAAVKAMEVVEVQATVAVATQATEGVVMATVALD